MNNLVRRFRKNDEGAIAIEFAFITPILAGLFLATLDLGATGFTQNKLTSSLRFSAQYIANGGEDLSVAENVFARSYGTYETFSTTVACSCARARGTLETDSEDQTAQSPVDEIVGVFTGNTSDAPQCQASCGDAPTIQYLTLSASAPRMAIWGGETQYVSNSVSVRLK